METLKPYTPVSIPASAKGGETPGVTGVAAGGGGVSDVSVSTVNESKLIDTAPDARQNQGAAQTPAAEPAKPAAPAAGAVVKPVADPMRGPVPDAALPQNHTGKMSPAEMAKLLKKQDDLMKKKQAQRAKEQKKAQDELARKNKNKKKDTAAPAAPQPAAAEGSTIKQ
jgi:uncharacterized protein with WD repeat